jgi:hypothetical protein
MSTAGWARFWRRCPEPFDYAQGKLCRRVGTGFHPELTGGKI